MRTGWLGSKGFGLVSGLLVLIGCFLLSTRAESVELTALTQARAHKASGDFENAAALYYDVLKTSEPHSPLHRTAEVELTEVILNANLNSPESEPSEVLSAIAAQTQKPLFASARFSLVSLSNAPLAEHEAAMSPAVLSILDALEKEDTDAALNDALLLQARYPTHPVSHNLVGLAWGQKNDLVKAEAAFKEALALNPPFKAARLNLASIKAKQGAFVEAHEAVDTVLSDAPMDRRALLMKAAFYTEEGNTALAQQWTDKASEVL